MEVGFTQRLKEITYKWNEAGFDYQDGLFPRYKREVIWLLGRDSFIPFNNLGGLMGYRGDFMKKCIMLTGEFPAVTRFIENSHPQTNCLPVCLLGINIK